MGVGPIPYLIPSADFSTWQKINLLLLERREHKLGIFLAAASCCLRGLPQDQTEPLPPPRADELACDIGTRRNIQLGLDKLGVAW